jgi:hypothetical protein
VNVADILCIGCLEKRIGRTLCRADFEDVPINDPNEFPAFQPIPRPFGGDDY